MFQFNLKDLLNSGVILTLLPGWSYLCCFVYEYPFAQKFQIDTAFISVSITDVLIFSVYALFGGSAIIIGILYIILFKEPSNSIKVRGYQMLVVCAVISVFFLYYFISAAFVLPLSFKDLLWPLIFAFWIFVLAKVAKRRQIALFKKRSIAPEVIKRWNRLQKSLFAKTIGLDLPVFVLAILFIPGGMHYKGICDSASEQTLLQFKDNYEWLVMRRYGDFFYCKPLMEDTCLIDSLKIVNVDNVADIKFSKRIVRLGAIKYYTLKTTVVEVPTRTRKKPSASRK